MAESRLVLFLVFLLTAMCLLQGCTASSIKPQHVPFYYSVERVLRDLDTSLWTGQEDLAPGVLFIGGRTVSYPQLHASVPHVGFSDGLTTNRRLMAFSISVRGRRLAIPRQHWEDLFNLSFKNKAHCAFGSSGDYDVVKIGGSDGERGYHVYFVSKNGKYLGRRLARNLDQPVDDFSICPDEF